MQPSWVNSSQTLREDSGNAFVHAKDKKPVVCSSKYELSDFGEGDPRRGMLPT